MRPEDLQESSDDVFHKEEDVEPGKLKDEKHKRLENAEFTKPQHFHHPEYVEDEETCDYKTQTKWEDMDRDTLVEHVRLRTGNWSARDSDEEFDEDRERKQEKEKRTVEEIKKLRCSLGELYLKEQEKEEQRLLRCEIDPRVASRSPNANKEVNAKLRYETPIFASPSRTSKDLRTKLASYPPPTSVSCNQQLLMKSANLQTDSASASDLRHPPEQIIPKGTSMPDVRQYPQILPYDILKTTNTRRPKGVFKFALEKHLSRQEFESVFKMSPEMFYSLPAWRQASLKKDVYLF